MTNRLIADSHTSFRKKMFLISRSISFSGHLYFILVYIPLPCEQYLCSVNYFGWYNISLLLFLKALFPLLMFFRSSCTNFFRMWLSRHTLGKNLSLMFSSLFEKWIKIALALANEFVRHTSAINIARDYEDCLWHRFTIGILYCFIIFFQFKIASANSTFTSWKSSSV